MCEKVAGYELIREDEIFVIVNGDLICELCNRKMEELTALKETDKAYCMSCFFKNREELLKNVEGDYFHICLIRNDKKD